MSTLVRLLRNSGGPIVAMALLAGCWLEPESGWSKLVPLPLGSSTDRHCLPRTTPALPKQGEITTCYFPPEADSAGIHFANVDASVCVDEYGKPTAVIIHDHLGSGFDLATRKCLSQLRFTPAKNSAGQWVPGASPPILVKFRR